MTTLTSSGRDERGSDCDEPPELMSDSDDERWNSDDEESDESDLHEENESIRVRGEARVAYLTGPKTTEWYEVLLDNQANTLIMHPRLLRDIRRTEHPAKVGGVSGHTVNIDLIGHPSPPRCSSKHPVHGGCRGQVRRNVRRWSIHHCSHGLPRPNISQKKQDVRGRHEGLGNIPTITEQVSYGHNDYAK